MSRSHVALFLFALHGCAGSDSGSAPATTSGRAASATEPSVTTTAAPSEPGPVEPATPPGEVAAEPAPATTHAAVTDSDDWAERERRTFVFQGAARGNVAGIAIARGGTHVAIGSNTGFVTVLDSASGEVRASERIARSNLVRFDLELVGDVALVGWADPGGGSGVELWRWRTGARIDVAATNELEGQDNSVALSPRGDRFAVASSDTLGVGAAGSGRITTRTEHESNGDLSWPHASALVEVVPRRSSSRGIVHVYDPRTLGELWSAPHDAAAIVRPAGDRIAILDGADVVVRALPGGEERSRVSHGLANASRIAIAREGDRVVVSSDTASVTILLADGARTEIGAGRALWISPRNVLVETDDGAVRRWVLDRSRLGAHVAPPRVEAAEVGYDEPSNVVEIDATGTVVSGRGDHVEIVLPSGERRVFAHGGEHSVWSVVADPARTGLVIGGRFGVQAWRPTGARDTACRGGDDDMVVDWQAGTLLSAGGCDLANGRAPRDTEPPHAVSLDGRFLVGRDGRFVERATSRSVQLEGVEELYCSEDAGSCVQTDAIGPNGTAVRLWTYFEADEEDDEDEDEEGWAVYETTHGRSIAQLPSFAAMAYAPDGSGLAHAQRRTLRWFDLAGGDHAPRTLVPGPDDDPDSQRFVALAVSPDGRSIAWAPENGHVVHIVAVSDGHDTASMTVGAVVTSLRWSASGTQLALRTPHELRIYDVGVDTPVRTLRRPSGTLDVTCAEGVLRWIRDAAEGGFEVVDLGACDAGDRVQLVGTTQIAWIDEGVVRLRRLDDGSELVFRTLHQDTATRHHLAHDAEGHWWTDDDASESAPVPTWVRHGDGRGGETTPLDPAMRRDDLLVRFFAAR